MSLYRLSLDEIPDKSTTDKAIVLDLDETLVHTYDDSKLADKLNLYKDPQLIPVRSRMYKLTLENVMEKQGKGTQFEMWGVLRPHLKEFLIFCFSYFKVVAVWSAGRKEYVEAVVNFIFKDLPDPHIIYTFDDCEFEEKIGYHKPLLKMINIDPELSKYMNLSNTFVLDDRETTFAENPSNGILIPIYSPVPTISGIMSDDICLRQLMYWLLSPAVIKSTDVRTLDKSSIFSTSIPKLQADAGF